MNKYIIGIDGGGTKTIGYLFDEKGKVLEKMENGFSNFSVDEMVATSNIKTIIDYLYEKIDDTDLNIKIVMGIAGASKFLNKGSFISDLEAKYQAQVILENDAVIALYSLKKNIKNKNFILAIGGTGSAVMSYDDKIRLFGGYGHILGDEGSAYHTVIESFRQIIRNYERNKSTLFDKCLLKTIHQDDAEGIKNFVYNHSKSDIAALAQQISYLADNGSKEAINILEKEGRMLAKQIITAYKSLSKDKEVIIGLRGGFILKNKFAQNALKKELDKHIKGYTLETNGEEPVVGTYYLGKDK
ncbi:hypothetical protein LJC17_00605 [Acholeplasma sp. OttesenSCG-928-E16]|nr:hypothetical protein [Acholeplasma sp. OttesenSCG-928-E16]